MSGEEERPESPSLERRVKQAGRHVGDQYVRIMRPTGSGIRGHGGRYVATDGKEREYSAFPRPLSWRVRGEECMIAENRKRHTPVSAGVYRLTVIEWE